MDSLSQISAQGQIHTICNRFDEAGAVAVSIGKRPYSDKAESQTKAQEQKTGSSGPKRADGPETARFLLKTAIFGLRHKSRNSGRISSFRAPKMGQNTAPKVDRSSALVKTAISPWLAFDL